MSEIYVEVTKEHLALVKDKFDLRATQFLIDYKQRRITYLLEQRKPKTIFGVPVRFAPINRMEAEMVYNSDHDEQSLARQIAAGMTRLQQIFVAASMAPAGTKFLVTIEDFNWFAL